MESLTKITQTQHLADSIDPDYSKGATPGMLLSLRRLFHQWSRPVYKKATAAAAAANAPPCTFKKAPAAALGAEVVSAADVELDVLEDELELVDEALSVLLESVEVAVDEESVELDVPVLVPEVEPVDVALPDVDVPAGREAVPDAPATVKAGAKFTLLGLSSSVMRMVYSPSALTALAGMTKVADSAEAGTSAAHGQFWSR